MFIYVNIKFHCVVVQKFATFERSSADFEIRTDLCYQTLHISYWFLIEQVQFYYTVSQITVIEGPCKPSILFLKQYNKAEPVLPKTVRNARSLVTKVGPYLKIGTTPNGGATAYFPIRGHLLPCHSCQY